MEAKGAAVVHGSTDRSDHAKQPAGHPHPRFGAESTIARQDPVFAEPCYAIFVQNGRFVEKIAAKIARAASNSKRRRSSRFAILHAMLLFCAVPHMSHFLESVRSRALCDDNRRSKMPRECQEVLQGLGVLQGGPLTPKALPCSAILTRWRA